MFWNWSNSKTDENRSQYSTFDLEHNPQDEFRKNIRDSILEFKQRKHRNSRLLKIQNIDVNDVYQVNKSMDVYLKYTILILYHNNLVDIPNIAKSTKQKSNKDLKFPFNSNNVMFTNVPYLNAWYLDGHKSL